MQIHIVVGGMADAADDCKKSGLGGCGESSLTVAFLRDLADEEVEEQLSGKCFLISSVKSMVTKLLLRDCGPRKRSFRWASVWHNPPPSSCSSQERDKNQANNFGHNWHESNDTPPSELCS